MSMRDELTTSSDSNGGFGHGHKTIEVVKPRGHDVEFGADPLPAEVLVTAVRARLGADLALGVDAHQIIVAREGRAMLLRGTVPTSEASEIAESVVRGTPGVTEVINQLVVADG